MNFDRVESCFKDPSAEFTPQQNMKIFQGKIHSFGDLLNQHSAWTLKLLSTGTVSCLILK